MASCWRRLWTRVVLGQWRRFGACRACGAICSPHKAVLRLKNTVCFMNEALLHSTLPLASALGAVLLARPRAGKLPSQILETLAPPVKEASADQGESAAEATESDA